MRVQRTRFASLHLVALVCALACGGDAAGPVTPDPVLDTLKVPLIDMGSGTYKGFTGGLYPNGANTPPAAHIARAVAATRLIQPLNTAGQPSATGKYVLLSIGMSVITQAWCAENGTVCDPWTFSGKAAADPAVNHTTLVIANGARGGQNADFWDSPTQPNYNRVRDEVLAPAGLSEAQVQIVWTGPVLARPTIALPDANADAYQLIGNLGNIVRALRVRYPNLRMIFVSSRSYAGFATINLNPEPFAYETGFAFKWLVEAQIKQLDGGAIDARAGDLSLAQTAWLGWGPYFWAPGASRPRSDGLFWTAQDFEPDGTHESRLGEEKTANMLLAFFKTSPAARCWFLASMTC
jgi:hypothetical protein